MIITRAWVHPVVMAGWQAEDRHMSKFKIGDRVIVKNAASTMCKVGDVGVIIGVQDAGACVHREGIDPLTAGWWFDADHLAHVVNHPTVTAAHAAIDRLATHLEREATEHVHALDALRAECESLRAINGNLREEVARLTHIVEESRRIHEVNAAVDLG